MAVGAIGGHGKRDLDRFDHTLVVWNDVGLAFHADSGLPVTGEVIKAWPGGVRVTEGPLRRWCAAGLRAPLLLSAGQGAGAP
jgi:hypothetical protein